MHDKKKREFFKIGVFLLIVLTIGTVFYFFLKKESATQDIPVKLYYYNPSLDQGPGGAQCTEKGLSAVTRSIPDTPTPWEDALRLLLRGEISEEEKAAGLTSEYPLSGLNLQAVSLKNGELLLVFDDPQNMTSGGSCRVNILRLQIEATAEQFPEIKNVRFSPEEVFQP